ncbi:MAG: hypothetical protein AAGI12_16030, partial [Pseudomonadota bacterium]
HPSVYRAFKQNGSEPISIRALKKDPLTGTTQELKTPNDLLVRDIISEAFAPTPKHKKSPTRR